MLQPIEPQTYESPDNGAKEAIASAAAGILHVRPHTENRTDAGEGGIAVGKKSVEQRREHRGQSSLYAPKAQTGNGRMYGTVLAGRMLRMGGDVLPASAPERGDMGSHMVNPFYGCCGGEKIALIIAGLIVF